MPAGRATCRCLHPRRRLHRPHRRARPGRGRLQGHRAGSQAHRLGRLRAQRRPGHRRLRLRAGNPGSAGRRCRRAAAVRLLARRHAPATRAHRTPRHRLRLARRPRPRAAEAAPGAGLAARHHAHGRALRLPAGMVGPRAYAAGAGQPALPGRDVRPGQRPSASAGLCAGPGARGAGGRRAHPRGFAGLPAGARHARDHADRPGQRQRRVRRDRRQCPAAGHFHSARAPHHAGGHLCRCDAAAGPGPRAR